MKRFSSERKFSSDETKDLGIEKEKIEKTQKTAKIQDLESRLDKVEKEIQEYTQRHGKQR